MNDIKKHALSDLYDMSSGITTTKDQAGHGSPFVSFSTVFNNYFLPDTLPDLMNTSAKEQETYSIKEGDILLTRTSETINELAMSCVALKDYPKATYSGFTKRLRPKTEGIAYSKYLAFYLRGNLFRKAVSNNAFMTLRASFNEDIFSFLNLYLPNYDEQVRIGDLLYCMEQKIQLNNRIIAELEEMAKTIFDYWFKQFDFPNTEGDPYRTSGGSMIWNEKLKREIPKGWEIRTMDTLVSISTSSFNPRKHEDSSIVEHYSIPAYDENRFPVFEPAFKIASGKYKVEKDNILFSKLNPHFKRIWDPYCLSEMSACSTEFIVYKCNQISNRPFCFAVLNSDTFSQFAVSNSSSSTGSRRRLSPEDTMHFLFAAPKDTKIIEEFCKIYEPILDKIKTKFIENHELANLRDWLIPMMMNGQVTVNNEE
jgi:type I restriction enzyme, S subunit